MIEIFAFVVLIFSFLGILIIFLKKYSVLVSLSPEIKTSKENLFSKIKDKVLKNRPLRSFSSEEFLHKILSKVRILILKTDNKTSRWLQQLRESSRRKKEKENDNYWEDLKNSTNQKDKNLPS